MNRKQVIVIGLDGASYPQVNKWIEQGDLPTLARMKARGCAGKLLATIPCVSASSLCAMTTGQNSGKTGIFDFSKLDGSVYSFRDLKQQTIWEILGDMGKKVLIAGVENTFPPKSVNGVLIGGFPLLSDEEDYTYPKELKKDTRGFHLPPSEYRELMSAWDSKDFEKIYELVEAQLNRQEKIFFNLQKKHDYDFTMLWLAATDTIQHYCWEREDLVLKIFQKIDKLIATILASYPSADLLVVSDHGFEVMPSYQIHLNNFLIDEGYLILRGNWFRRMLIYLANVFAENKVAIWLRASSLRARRKNIKRINVPSHIQRQVLAKPLIPGLDRKKSVAYLAQRWGINLIKENLGGRYDQTRDEIIAKLKNLKDTVDNPLIRFVKKREELYAGPYLEQIPDIIFISETGYIPSKFLRVRFSSKLFYFISIFLGNRLTTLFFQFFGVATQNLSQAVVTKIRGKKKFAAYHEMAIDGIFFAYGPNFQEHNSLGTISMLDIAPSILAHFGVEAPHEMDGKIIENLFKNRPNISSSKNRYFRGEMETILEGLDI